MTRDATGAADTLITVRPALLEDASGITLVHITAWQVAYRGIFPDRFLDDLSAGFDDRMKRWQVIITTPEQPGSVTLVAERDGEILGWLSYGPSRDEDAPPAEGEVYGIYIHPEHWGSGAGHALMDQGTKELRAAGYAEATLWVLEDNPRARRFYARHGWREDGAIEEFERGGATAMELRYRRPLTDREGPADRKGPAD